MWENPVVAVAFADAHFWPRPPVARSAEKDWLAAQVRVIEQLAKIQEEVTTAQSSNPPVPFLFAGDLFERYNPPPEIINLLLATLPGPVYGVPGNHDLPNQSYADLRKSAFFTLVKADKIVLLKPGRSVEFRGSAVPLRLRGFPAGAELRPLPEGDPTNALCLNIAVVHHYVWASADSGFLGASEGDLVGAVRKKLGGFDLIICGDNHKGFTARNKTPTIYNCGGLQRRKIDEVASRPAVGLVRSDGSVERRYLDCGDDKFIDPGEAVKLAEQSGDLKAFVKELGNLADADIDFKQALLRALNRAGAPKAVRTILLEAMGDES